MNKTAAAAICLALAATPTANAETALEAAVAKDYDTTLGALFEHFHRNPELSFLESKTAARLAEELRGLGVEVTEGVGGTGIVGVFKNGGGPTVLIRADMDGLPVAERSGLSYASTVTQTDLAGRQVPVMHACGHDVHMTTLVGTAKRLIALKQTWSGTVLFIGQPAEERIGGAKAMLEDGLYERFPRPDYVLAMHVAADMPLGKIAFAPGLMYSSSDSVNITVRGIGSHGAAPHRGKDPVVLAAEIVLALQTLVSREISPLHPGVITVGSIHGGLKHNIIPDRVDLQITVRANDEETRATLLAGIKRVAENAGRMAGLPENLLPIVDLSVEATPTTYNDPAMAQRIETALRRDIGEAHLAAFEQRNMGAEDFAYFVQTDPPVPGVYFQVGGTPEAAFAAERAGGPPVAAHHSPLFKVEPRLSVITGVEAMTVAAIELLGRR